MTCLYHELFKIFIVFLIRNYFKCFVHDAILQGYVLINEITTEEWGKVTCSQLYSGITTVNDERVKKHTKKPPILLFADPNLVTTIGSNPTWILAKEPHHLNGRRTPSMFLKMLASTTTLLLPHPLPNRSKVKGIWCFLQVCGMLKPHHHIKLKGCFMRNTFQCG